MSVCLSECVCVCLSVCVHNNSKNNGSIDFKLEPIVVYENSSDEFDIGHCSIKVLRTARDVSMLILRYSMSQVGIVLESENSAVIFICHLLTKCFNIVMLK